jgi:RNA polymerase sigma-70 factor (ECF subfamily)
MIEQAAKSTLEARVRAQLDAGAPDRAVDVLVRGMGPEILGFLVAVTRDEGLGSDAFSFFCEDVWKGLASFRFESSLRTWCFTVARNAASRAARAPRRKREVALDGASVLERLEHEVRQSTFLHMKTEVKDRVKKLRDALDADEQTLLILRVDKKLEWDEVARVMLDDEAVSDAAIKKKAAALRKRYERVKERLTVLAKAEGLIA